VQAELQRQSPAEAGRQRRLGCVNQQPLMLPGKNPGPLRLLQAQLDGKLLLGPGSV